MQFELLAHQQQEKKKKKECTCEVLGYEWHSSRKKTIILYASSWPQEATLFFDAGQDFTEAVLFRGEMLMELTFRTPPPSTTWLMTMFPSASFVLKN